MEGSMTKMISVAVWTTLSSLGVAALVFARAVPASEMIPARVRAQSGSTETPTLANDCGGGVTPQLQISPILDAIERNTAGAELLHYHLEFEHAFPEQVKVNFAATLADDHGNVIRTSKAPSAIPAAAGARAVSTGLSTPKLADGFYHLAITGAALGNASEATNTAQVYLEVAGGKITEIEEEDWFRRSHANDPVELGPASPVVGADAGTRGGQ
jgi:hypothetical protein